MSSASARGEGEAYACPYPLRSLRLSAYLPSASQRQSVHPCIHQARGEGAVAVPFLLSARLRLSCVLRVVLCKLSLSCCCS